MNIVIVGAQLSFIVIRTNFSAYTITGRALLFHLSKGNH